MTYNRLLLRQMDPELRITPQVVKPVKCPRCLDRPKRINNKDCCRCQDEEAFCNNDVAKKSQVIHMKSLTNFFFLELYCICIEPWSVCY